MKIYKPPSEKSFLQLTPDQQVEVRKAIEYSPQRWEKSLLLALDELREEVQQLEYFSLSGATDHAD
jgi:hypothetical protein